MPHQSSRLDPIEPDALRTEVHINDYNMLCGAGGAVRPIDPRRPKYPISAMRIPDGKGYKFTAENVALLLKAAMKDVSPKA